VGLFWDTKHTHTHIYLLTYLPGPTRGIKNTRDHSQMTIKHNEISVNTDAIVNQANGM